MRCGGRRRGQREQGFSLVEMLVAVTLIGIAALGYGALNLQTVDLAARNDALSPESAAAAGKLEEFARTPYAELAAGTDTVALPDGRRITRSWTVQDDTPVAGCRTVRVTVAAEDPTSVPVILETIFTELQP